MSATLTATVAASVNWVYAIALAGPINVNVQSGFSYSQALVNGTGAINTANLIYAAQITIASSGNTSLDFATGLTDFFGTAIAMARVKYLYIHLTTTTAASSISVGNATHPLPITSAGTATIPINNNGILVLGDAGATAMAVGSGATDSVKIVNNDGALSAVINFVAIGSTV